MKEIIEALDFVIEVLRAGDSSLAGILLLALRAKLILKSEDDKIRRETGRQLARHKKKMIHTIKKLKL